MIITSIRAVPLSSDLPCEDYTQDAENATDDTYLQERREVVMDVVFDDGLAGVGVLVVSLVGAPHTVRRQLRGDRGLGVVEREECMELVVCEQVSSR